jgi:hypothetical protein
MSPPRNERSGPRAAEPEDRHHADQAAAKRAKSVLTSVTGARRKTAATARVSLLFPSERRTCWWYLVTCPVCREPHLGRSRDLAGVTGTRRLPCRHWVVVVVAKTYGRTGSGAAA